MEQYSRKINIVQLAFYDKLCNPYVQETHFMRKITGKKFYTSLFMSCISLFSACWLGGCEMIEYHPYDLDIDGETGINDKNTERIETALEGKNEFSFIFISDTQRWYDETADAVAAINRLKGVDFVIHGGDLSDFGMKLEFELQRDILNKLQVPYVCLLGNHDCLATGEEVFLSVFGGRNFSFNAGDTHFVCLNTNALEFDYSEAVPDLAYMESDSNGLPEGITRTIAVMHAAPFTEQFNNNIARVFQHYIKEYPALQFCLAGHTHNLAVEDIFDDGTLYYTAPSIKKRTLMRFTFTSNGYDYETIPF